MITMPNNAPNALPTTHEPQTAAAPRSAAPDASDQLAAYGIHPLPRRGGSVSNELIAQLRDQEGI